MMNTIIRDRNNAIKLRATVNATWNAFNSDATPEEITWAINSQARDNEKVTVAQVRRSMRDMGEPRTNGSNHYRKTAEYVGRQVNPRWVPKHRRHSL